VTTHRNHQNLEFECDGCDELFESNESDFSLAWSMAKRDNWITRKIGSDWHHYCPNCGEGFR